MNSKQLIINNEKCNNIGEVPVSAPNKNKYNSNAIWAGLVLTKNQRGITLIALLIMIIILLILAGVTISIIFNDNGIFKTAQQAVKNYVNAEKNELNEIEELNNKIKADINKDKQVNSNWKKVLNLAGIDETKFETFQKALELDSVREAIMNIESTETTNFINVENPYYTFEAKANKKYFIQCFGGQGGSYSSKIHGGYGGYSLGIFESNKDVILYIYIGGEGSGNLTKDKKTGGYNGGGSIVENWADGNERRACGGGATHIALVPRLTLYFRK